MCQSVPRYFFVHDVLCVSLCSFLHCSPPFPGLFREPQSEHRETQYIHTKHTKIKSQRLQSRTITSGPCGRFFVEPLEKLYTHTYQHIKRPSVAQNCPGKGFLLNTTMGYIFLKKQFFPYFLQNVHFL